MYVWKILLKPLDFSKRTISFISSWAVIEDVNFIY